MGWPPPAPPGDAPLPPTAPDRFSVPGGPGGASIGGMDLSLAAAALGSLGLFVWAVPGLFLSVPGILVVLIVLAQGAGGLAWIPIARRRLGSFGFARRSLDARHPRA